MTTPTKYDDVIDSRDVIARIEELQDERSALEETMAECGAAVDADGETAAQAFYDARKELAEWTADNGEELAALLALAAEAEGYAEDWQHGTTLVRDSYFRNYAMELADDIGATNDNDAWPLNCIDWDKAERELQMDYTSVSFDGIDYWIR